MAAAGAGPRDGAGAAGREPGPLPPLVRGPSVAAGRALGPPPRPGAPGGVGRRVVAERRRSCRRELGATAGLRFRIHIYLPVCHAGLSVLAGHSQARLSAFQLFSRTVPKSGHSPSAR